MKKYNVIVVFNKDLTKTLMCKRTKEPYKNMYNLVGGKIEKENDGLSEAYRELYEETNISKSDVTLEYFMNIEYVVFNKILEVYYGILNKEVNLIEEVNKLEWVSINDNFFDMKKYAGEGNIGHIIEEIKISMKENRKLLKEVLKEIRHDMTDEEVLNLLAVKAFDPFPFILLNLVLSCVAAIQAHLIMMSQNRQEEKDRRRAENDYKVNLKTEIMIEDLYDKVNAILAKQSALERQARGDLKEESETAE